MSNVFTAIVNLCDDPEATPSDEAGKGRTKIRLANNTRKDAPPRYFSATLWGYGARDAARLSKGDQLVITGELGKEKFKYNKGKNAGQWGEADVLNDARIVKVLKSDTFYAKKEEPNTSLDPQPEPGDMDNDNAGGLADLDVE